MDPWVDGGLGVTNGGTSVPPPQTFYCGKQVGEGSV